MRTTWVELAVIGLVGLASLGVGASAWAQSSGSSPTLTSSSWS